MGQLFGEGGKLDISLGNKPLLHIFPLILFHGSYLCITCTHLDAHLTLSHSFGVNDLVL